MSGEWTMPHPAKVNKGKALDTEGQFYDKPLDRYSLNRYVREHDKLHTEDDKLVVHVQHDEATDPNQRQNWLPTPKVGVRFTARFYAPTRR
jgi:hypothetical protein